MSPYQPHGDSKHQEREELLLNRILDKMDQFEDHLHKVAEEMAYTRAIIEGHKIASGEQHGRIMDLEGTNKKQLYFIIGGMGTILVSTIGLLVTIILGL